MLQVFFHFMFSDQNKVLYVKIAKMSNIFDDHILLYRFKCSDKMCTILNISLFFACLFCFGNSYKELDPNTFL